MINAKEAIDSISRLALLKFFPSEESARGALVRIVCSLVETNEGVDWLVDNILTLYNEWPGPMELRAVVSARRKPADGIEGHSTVYLSNIPTTPLPAPEKAAFALFSGPTPRQIA